MYPATFKYHAPASVDEALALLGPSRQEEIAVAVLAEVVAWSHDRASTPTALSEAVDPVCGMTVTVEAATEAVDHDGVTYHFCCPACRSRFEADPARFLEAEAR